MSTLKKLALGIAGSALIIGVVVFLISRRWQETTQSASSDLTKDFPLKHIYAYGAESRGDYIVCIEFIVDSRKTDYFIVALKNISFKKRNDGEAFTSVRFGNTKNSFEVKSAVILVPEDADLEIWLKAVQRWEKERDDYLKKIDEETRPKRVLPLEK